MAVPGEASRDHACQLGASLYGPCQWRSRAEPRWTMLDSWGPYWYLSVRSAATNHDSTPLLATAARLGVKVIFPNWWRLD